MMRDDGISQAEMGVDPDEGRIEWEALTEEEREAYYAELRELAYGPLPANPGAVDWTRDDMRDERDAWDQTIPVAEFDGTPF
jgi:hypothetical protein